MLRSVRYSINTVVQERVANSSCTEKPGESYEEALRDWHKNNKKTESSGGEEKQEKKPKRPDPFQFGWNGSAPAKVLFVTADARAVTMVIPNELLIPESPMIANLKPHNKLIYEAARWSGWIAFAVQVITLGQAALPTQIITVALMVVPTVLFVMKFGCDDSPWLSSIKKVFMGEKERDPHSYDLFEPVSVSWIGSRLKAEVYYWPWSHEIVEEDGILLAPGDHKSKSHFKVRGRERQNKRQHMYACLQLTKQEGVSMDKWDLFPHERGNNTKWMQTYEDLKQHIHDVQLKTNMGIKSIKAGPTKSNPAKPHEHPATAPAGLPLNPVGQAPIRAPTGASKTTGASTAQDGSDLDPGASAEDPPKADVDVDEPRSAVESPVDPVDNIRPVVRASTMPVSAHGQRRQSLSTPSGQSSAYWMTRFTQDHENQDGSPR